MGATTKGRWSYACSKAIDEFLALAYWREKKLPTIVVRLFNTVGPRQTGQYGMVIPTFVKQALAGRPITVYGDGKQTRCFGYVGDVVEALVGADGSSGRGRRGLQHRLERGGLDRRAGRARQELTELESEIVLVPYSEAYEEGFEDMPRRVPDTSKIGALIGFRPETTLDDDPRRRDRVPLGRQRHVTVERWTSSGRRCSCRRCGTDESTCAHRSRSNTPVALSHDT